jgi:hypothetical protein
VPRSLPRKNSWGGAHRDHLNFKRNQDIREKCGDEEREMKGKEGMRMQHI